MCFLTRHCSFVIYCLCQCQPHSDHHLSSARLMMWCTYQPFKGACEWIHILKHSQPQVWYLFSWQDSKSLLQFSLSNNLLADTALSMPLYLHKLLQIIHTLPYPWHVVKSPQNSLEECLAQFPPGMGTQRKCEESGTLLLSNVCMYEKKNACMKTLLLRVMSRNRVTEGMKENKRVFLTGREEMASSAVSVVCSLH